MRESIYLSFLSFRTLFYSSCSLLVDSWASCRLLYILRRVLYSSGRLVAKHCHFIGHFVYIVYDYGPKLLDALASCFSPSPIGGVHVVAFKCHRMDPFLSMEAASRLPRSPPVWS